MIKASLKWFWYSIALTVIIVAVMVSAARLLMPQLDELTPRFEAYLSKKSGTKVSIGKVEGVWRAYGPELSLFDVSFHSPTSGEELMSLKQLRLALDIPQSLFARDTVLRKFELDGIRSSLALDRNGQFIFPGFNLDTSGETTSAVSFIRSLLRHDKVAITNVVIQYFRADGDQFEIQMPALRVRNREGFHQLLGDLSVHEGGSAKLVIEMSGYPLTPKDEMSLYLESDSLKLDKLPLPTGLVGVVIDSGALELRLWSHWREGSWKESQFNLQLNDAHLINHRQERKKIEELAGAFEVQRIGHAQWHILSQNVNVVVDGETWAPLWLKGIVEKNEQNVLDWHLDFGEIDLSRLLGDIQFSNVLSDEWRARLNALNLDTRVPLVQLDISTDDEQIISWAMAAEFQDFRYQSDKLPILEGVSGRLLMSELGGALRLRGQKASIDFHQLFRTPLMVDDLDIGLRWSQSDSDLLVSVPYLRAENADFNVLASAAIQFPVHDEPSFSLNAQLTHGNGENTSMYLPVGVMSESLVAYLDTSIKNAQVKDARVLLRGPLKGFPYLHDKGVFFIEAQTEKGEFEFNPSWPVVKDIEAKLTFDADDMHIEVQQASMANWQVQASTVTLNQMLDKDHMLHIEASGFGDAQQAKATLLQSPISATIKSITDVLDVQGDLQSALTLDIPLSPEHTLNLKGRIQLDQNRVVVKPIHLPMRSLMGHLEFSHEGLTGGEFNAKLLGGDLSGLVEVQGKNSRIKLSGTIEHNDLALWQPYPLQDYIDGQIRFTGQASIPNVHQSSFALNLQSDLQALSVKLPAPFGKQLGARQPLNATLLSDTNGIQLSANYADVLRVEAEQKEAKLWHMEMLLGNAQYTGHHPGLTIRGTMPSINLSEWTSIIAHVIAQPSAGFATPESRAEREPEVSWTPRLALYVNTVNAFDYPLNAVSIGGHSVSAGYELEFSASELTGKALFATDQPIALSFADFNFFGNRENAEQEISANADSVLEAISPNALVQSTVTSGISTQNATGDDDIDAERIGDVRLPNESARWSDLDIHCLRCSVKDFYIGNLSATVRHEADDEIFRFQSTIPSALNIAGDIRWSAAQNRSVAMGKLSSASTGQLSDAWQLRRAIEDSSGQLDFNLSWPGRMADFNQSSVEGDFSVSLSKGTLTLTSDKGARLFSLLSLQSLLRRLSLDFSDLFESGFHFDGMQGQFNLKNGIASTSNARIDGVSANVLITGNTDLVHQTFDQYMVVQPELSSSLPVLAGWIISPTTGVLMWVMNKLFIEPAVNVVTGLEYRVTGTWDEPVIVEQKRTQKEIPLPEGLKKDGE